MGISIFLVEDEALIRRMLVEMLEELGHRVVAEAGSVQEAEPFVAARGQPFVFVSGYGPEGAPASFKDMPVLRKPFLIEFRRHDQRGGERSEVGQSLGPNPILATYQRRFWA
ncbi:response regulator [Bradyrhizobium sp. JYMT SZCCT0428]|uniref:response regulator n=1 Tax=Bradyrhizobium sp. JYMT SZCCT0428 TaxID=2807673 RepID=UPI0020135234